MPNTCSATQTRRGKWKQKLALCLTKQQTPWQQTQKRWQNYWPVRLSIQCTINFHTTYLQRNLHFYKHTIWNHSDLWKKSDAIKELRPSTASRPDEFSAILLANCSEQLAIPLEILWESSFQETPIPNKMKFSIIPPIHKANQSLPTIDPLPSPHTSSGYLRK